MEGSGLEQTDEGEGEGYATGRKSWCQMQERSLLCTALSPLYLGKKLQALQWAPKCLQYQLLGAHYIKGAEDQTSQDLLVKVRRLGEPGLGGESHEQLSEMIKGNWT